jgi:4-hydroxy-tetrahydrodipicolinate reductase
MSEVIVIGAGGRMGKRLITLIADDPELTLAGAVEAAGNAAVGADAGQVAGIAEAGIKVTDDLASIIGDGDVTIDFSVAAVAVGHARIAVDAGRAVVIGTTGLDRAQKVALKEMAAGGGRIVLAPNMSVGVNLLFKLCREAASILGTDYDMEVVEFHHGRKTDAPSGTAERLGEILAAATGLNYDHDTRHGRYGQIGPRSGAEIGMHALRGGDVVGEHTVIFATGGERVELTHKASSRDTFATGALRAANFAAAAEPGLYDMQDVLRLK